MRNQQITSYTGPVYQWTPAPAPVHNAERDGMRALRHVIATDAAGALTDEQIARAIHIAPVMFAGAPTDLTIRAVNRAVDRLRRAQMHRAELDASLAQVDASAPATRADERPNQGPQPERPTPPTRPTPPAAYREPVTIAF